MVFCGRRAETPQCLVLRPPMIVDYTRFCAPDRSSKILRIIALQAWKPLESRNQAPRTHVPTRGGTLPPERDNGQFARKAEISPPQLPTHANICRLGAVVMNVVVSKRNVKVVRLVNAARICIGRATSTYLRLLISVYQPLPTLSSRWQTVCSLWNGFSGTICLL